MEVKEIINGCLEDRPGAWTMLVQSYAEKIFNTAYQFTGNRAEAEDQTQEIFLKVFHSLRTFDKERNFDAWLLTMAKNHLIDAYRRTRWEKRNRDDFEEAVSRTAGPFSNPEDSLASRQDRALLWKGLNGLPPDMRMAVILKDIQGKAYEDVAEIMKLPVGTVKSRVSRAKLRLAGLLRRAEEQGHAL
ncbi:MAG: sigma-70 family RNA polymerase sigma factor [Candidatus Aminicenantes bacterium]|nr:sigma-70 family RNA polymerase sigma factor [Candidatus Aminicenantes bacterium]